MLKDGIDPPGQMTPSHRLVEMCLVQWLCDEQGKKDLGVWLVREGLQRAVVEVVRYELASVKKGGGGDAVMNWELVDMAGAVLL